MPRSEFGVIVDAVSEALTLQANDIEEATDFGGGKGIGYLLGMAKIKGRVKILPDINRVLSGAGSRRTGVFRRFGERSVPR